MKLMLLKPIHAIVLLIFNRLPYVKLKLSKNQKQFFILKHLTLSTRNGKFVTTNHKI